MIKLTIFDVPIKLNYIGLALKDQMPLTRLIKNLCKGHVLGLFHIRSHIRADGTPKVGYNTKETATRVAKEMMEKKGNYFSNYRCIFCGKYHLGRNREHK